MTLPNTLPSAGAGAAMQQPAAGERDGERHAPMAGASQPNCAARPPRPRIFGITRTTPHLFLAPRPCARCDGAFVPHQREPGRAVCETCRRQRAAATVAAR